MRSELKSYSNLIDNKNVVNNFISAIDTLSLTLKKSNRMYLNKLYTLYLLIFF